MLQPAEVVNNHLAACPIDSTRRLVPEPEVLPRAAAVLVDGGTEMMMQRHPASCSLHCSTRHVKATPHPPDAPSGGRQSLR
mmetsp:Transcript_46161/g.108060  ORF Transcript_46161/g.108060 Transcript_46161/m.108060 type:complete len:81 (+) Transcript_46161:132-374(+)